MKPRKETWVGPTDIENTTDTGTNVKEESGNFSEDMTVGNQSENVMMRTISLTLKLNFMYQIHLQLNCKLHNLCYISLHHITVVARLTKDYTNNL